MKIIILLGLLACVLGQNSKFLRAGFVLLDANKDGLFQLNEALSMFDQFDANGDGFITPDETFRSQLPQTTVKGAFNYLDKLDGKDDDLVARSSVNYIFNILDSDGDGVVSLEEFQKNVPQIVKGMSEEIAAVQVVG